MSLGLSGAAPGAAERARARCCSWLEDPPPLLGAWLQRRAVVELARDGSPEAARLLCRAVLLKQSGAARLPALAVLAQLETTELTAKVCEVWAETRNPDLARLRRDKGWVPEKPTSLHALCLLDSAQPEVLLSEGATMVPDLVTACGDRDPAISSRAREALSRLPGPEAVDALCQIWVERRQPLLLSLIHI